MKLLKPTKKYEKSWHQALSEFRKEKRHGFWNLFKEPSNLDEYIKETEDYSQGKNLPKDLVSASTFWLIDREKFIGHVNIRHQLNDHLKKHGGNIGYYIRPTERFKGYGTKMLELALNEAKKIGLKKVLITIDEPNKISRKITEKNNGKLQDTIIYKGKPLCRYWITLSQ